MSKYLNVVTFKKVFNMRYLLEKFSEHDLQCHKFCARSHDFVKLQLSVYLSEFFIGPLTRILSAEFITCESPFET